MVTESNPSGKRDGKKLSFENLIQWSRLEKTKEVAILVDGIMVDKLSDFPELKGGEFVEVIPDRADRGLVAL